MHQETTPSKPVTIALMPSAAGQAVFDEAAALGRLDDDKDLLAALLAMAFEAIPKTINALETALLNGEASQVKFHAHNLKGVAGSVGATALAAVAAQVQHAVADDQLLLIAPQVVCLQNEFARLQAQASQQGY